MGPPLPGSPFFNPEITPRKTAAITLSLSDSRTCGLLPVSCLFWQHVKKIVLSADEFLIVDFLNDAVAAHPKVTFGSYPFFSNPAYKTVSHRLRPPPPPGGSEKPPLSPFAFRPCNILPAYTAALYVGFRSSYEPTDRSLNQLIDRLTK